MEVTTITASYSRKINHEIYGGGRFESSDRFVSLSAEVHDMDSIVDVYAQLRTACEDMVNESLAADMASFGGGLTPQEFNDYLQALVARRPIDAETYQRANANQKAILQAAKRGLKMEQRDNQKEHANNTKKDA